MLPETYATLAETARKEGLRLGAWLDALATAGSASSGSARDMREFLALSVAVTKDKPSALAVQKRCEALGKKLGFMPDR